MESLVSPMQVRNSKRNITTAAKRTRRKQAPTAPATLDPSSQRIPETHHRKMEREAKRLEHLTGCTVDFQYQKTENFNDEYPHAGHIILGHFFPGFDHELTEADFLTIDTREGNLRRQLVKELRRVGKMYLQIASRVKGGAL